MNKFDFSNMEYIFIFDFYDEPLFFISLNKIDEKYYIFYSINENTYFYSDLSISDIDYLFENPSGYDILHYLRKISKLKLLTIDKDAYISRDLSDYEGIFNEDLEESFPDERFYIEYDYFHKVSFESIRSNYKEYFDTIYDAQQLTLRIKDHKNSNALDVKIVSSAIDYVINVWEDLKDRLTETISSKELLISAPSKGSLKLDFQLNSEQEVLFEDTASFSELIDFIDNLKYQTDDIEKFVTDRKLIEETLKFYSVVERNELSIDFLSDNKKVGNLKKSEKIKNKLLSMQATVHEELIKHNTSTEELNISGEVLAANKSKNYFKIKTLNLGDISGTFEKNLFRKIKNSEEQITISKNIVAKITKTTIKNIDTGDSQVKYILNSYTQ